MYSEPTVKTEVLERTVREGIVAGQRPRGRPRTSCTSNITDWTGLTYGEWIRRADRMADTDSWPPTVRMQTQQADDDDDDIIYGCNV